MRDVRAILIFAAMFAAMIGGSFEYANPFTEKLAEGILYGTWAAGGFMFALLAYKEGFTLNRPTITREFSPIRFWSEVVVAAGLGCVSLSKLWSLLVA
jgi:hypothetical protein